MRIKRKLAAVAAAGALALAMPAAFADTIVNDIDAAGELMNLTYDPNLVTQVPGTTTLTLQNGGQATDLPACDVAGATHYVTVAPSYDNTLIDVSIQNGGTFENCDTGDWSSLIVTVTPIAGPGCTQVTFPVVAQDTPLPNDNSPAKDIIFDTTQATFNVCVNGGNTVCDVDPAAPAWAAAILQKSGVKAYSKDWNNAISYVSHIMTNGATYEHVEKNAHPAYENAVDADLVVYFSGKKTIVTAQQAARPGWTCVTTG